MTVWVWIGVAALGGLGAIVRFLLDAGVGARSRLEFPLGTLVVNLSGAFVLGLLYGLGLAGNALLLAGTATIGAYTTFSTWVLETQRLAEDGQATGAIANLAVSLVAGVAAAALGRAIGAGL